MGTLDFWWRAEGIFLHGVVRNGLIGGYAAGGSRAREARPATDSGVWAFKMLTRGEPTLIFLSRYLFCASPPHVPRLASSRPSTHTAKAAINTHTLLEVVTRRRLPRHVSRRVRGCCAVRGHTSIFVKYMYITRYFESALQSKSLAQPYVTGRVSDTTTESCRPSIRCAGGAVVARPRCPNSVFVKCVSRPVRFALDTAWGARRGLVGHMACCPVVAPHEELARRGTMSLTWQVRGDFHNATKAAINANL